MKPPSCPSLYILWQQKAVKNNFQEKELMFYFGICKTFASLCDHKFFMFESIATDDLIWRKKFEIMGKSDLTHAHSNDLICMRYIRMNTVSICTC